MSDFERGWKTAIEAAAKVLISDRPEVRAFADAMEAQLRRNDHKPGWKNDHPADLIARLREETDELAGEVLGGNAVKIVREAADVANFAMMVADVCGGLETRAVAGCGCGTAQGAHAVGERPDCEYHQHHCEACHEKGICTRAECKPEPQPGPPLEPVACFECKGSGCHYCKGTGRVPESLPPPPAPRPAVEVERLENEVLSLAMEWEYDRPLNESALANAVCALRDALRKAGK